jgi:DeoR family glycerol-3-phosphate regulon repressor
VARRLIAQDEKRAIGRAAADIIPDGASLFINIGTTTEEVARSLLDRSGLLVITNNLNVAMLLYPHPRIDVIWAGGPVRRADGAVIGSAAVDFIRQFKVDYAVIGTSAIDADGSLLDFDYREVRVSQAIIANARQSILVADGMKFDRSAPVRLAHITDIDVFVTDHLPEGPVAELCRDKGIRVVECGPAERVPELQD